MGPMPVSPVSRKALNILHDDDDALVTSRNFLQKYVLDCTYSSFTKNHFYTDLPHTFWEQFLELSEMLSPRLYSPQFAPNKT